MEKFNFVVPCLFGVEGILADELRKLGKENVAASDGRVGFTGDFSDMVDANLWLRTGERVLLLVGEFSAKTFEELFENTKTLDWAKYIPKDAAFPVKGHSVNSKLFSISDCQSIIKKAIVNSLSMRYNISWFEETGEVYQVQFQILNDVVRIYIDTTGMALHKRGYRRNSNLAPIRETLAAAMVILSKYRGRETFYDPFCGSGTILIEAAMIAMNRAPGIWRKFSFEKFRYIDKNLLTEARNNAREKEFHREFQLIGSDLAQENVELTFENAKKAGVHNYIKVSQCDVRNFSPGAGILVTNPPYGERMGEIKDAQGLYKILGGITAKVDGLNTYVISSAPEFERFFGRRATKKRKLYNGMLKCDYYMYY